MGFKEEASNCMSKNKKTLRLKLILLSSSSSELCFTPLVFPGGSVVKNPPANIGDAGDVGLIPESGRRPGGEDGNPLQYS